MMLFIPNWFLCYKTKYKIKYVFISLKRFEAEFSVQNILPYLIICIMYIMIFIPQRKEVVQMILKMSSYDVNFKSPVLLFSKL